jgi:hypothetical protein
MIDKEECTNTTISCISCRSNTTTIKTTTTHTPRVPQEVYSPVVLGWSPLPTSPLQVATIARYQCDTLASHGVGAGFGTTNWTRRVDDIDNGPAKVVSGQHRAVAPVNTSVKAFTTTVKRVKFSVLRRKVLKPRTARKQVCPR